MGAVRSDGIRTEKRILSACAKLFLEHGYRKTTMKQILREAEVSSSSFQNIFGNKDGVLMELMRGMFENQFDAAASIVGEAGELPPVYTYAVETSVQIAITELNANVRECYLESYTYPEALDYIQRATAQKLHQFFGPYQPELSEDDFLVLEIGSSGLMRGFMASPCTDELTLERKVSAFLQLALRGFKVPETEVQQVLAFIAALDLRDIAAKVLDRLFHELAVHYDFSLEGVALQS